jgi:hypothetical protein
MTDYKPGPELDQVIAEKMGVVPCDGWREVNMGRAGGPTLMGDYCLHARGACYPTITAGSFHGEFGGLPKYSEDGNPMSLRLKDLPDGFHLVRLPDGSFRVENPEVQSWVGETEAHAICLAFLDSVEPEERDIWHPGWKEAALNMGITEASSEETGLPEPWTPEAVLIVAQMLQKVQMAAMNRKSRETTDENVIHCGPEPTPPRENREVGMWMSKLQNTGVVQEVLFQVWAFLEHVWTDTENYNDTPPVPLSEC